VVGRHTAGVALRSDGVQGSAVRVRGKGGNKQTVVAKPLFTLCTRGHLVEAKSSGDGVRDLGDVLGGKGDKGCSYFRRSALELPLGGVARERVGVSTGLRGCNGIRGGLGEAWFAH
jgi:hypothetical protein